MSEEKPNTGGKLVDAGIVRISAGDEAVAKAKLEAERQQAQVVKQLVNAISELTATTLKQPSADASVSSPVETTATQPLEQETAWAALEADLEAALTGVDVPALQEQLDAGEAERAPEKVTTVRALVLYEAKAAELLATRYYNCSKMAEALYGKHSPPELKGRYKRINSVRKLISPHWPEWLRKYHHVQK